MNDQMTSTLSNPKKLMIEEDICFRGDFSELISLLYEQNGVTLIIGDTDSGKTGIGLNLTETASAINGKKAYSISYKKDFPEWINQTPLVERVPKDSNCFSDEAWLTLSTDLNNSKRGKLLTGLLATAFHNDISFKFAVQNSYTLMKNVMRFIKVLVIKKPNIFQAETERDFLRKYVEKAREYFLKIPKAERVKYAYIVSDDYEGFVKNKLPSFWNEGIRKSFRRTDI